MDVKNLLSSLPSKSKEKLIKELHERTKSICVSEADVQKMIESAKEKIL